MASGEGCSASVVAGRGTAARTAPPLSGASEIDAVGRTVGPVAAVPTGKRVDKEIGSAVAGGIGAASVSSDDLEAAWLPVKEAGVSVSAGNRRNYPGYQQQDNPFCGPFHRPTVGPSAPLTCNGQPQAYDAGSSSRWTKCTSQPPRLAG